MDPGPGSAAAAGMTTEPRGRPRRLPSGPCSGHRSRAEPSQRRSVATPSHGSRWWMLCSASDADQSDHRVRVSAYGAATDSSGWNTDGTTLRSPTNLDSALSDDVASKMLPGRLNVCGPASTSRPPPGPIQMAARQLICPKYNGVLATATRLLTDAAHPGEYADGRSYHSRWSSYVRPSSGSVGQLG